MQESPQNLENGIQEKYLSRRPSVIHSPRDNIMVIHYANITCWFNVCKLINILQHAQKEKN